MTACFALSALDSIIKTGCAVVGDRGGKAPLIRVQSLLGIDSRPSLAQRNSSNIWLKAKRTSMCWSLCWFASAEADILLATVTIGRPTSLSGRLLAAGGPAHWPFDPQGHGLLTPRAIITVRSPRPGSLAGLGDHESKYFTRPARSAATARDRLGLPARDCNSRAEALTT